MKRLASCSCGNLGVSVQAEPTKISLCHCNACKRRTGSAFGIAVFFAEGDVEIAGIASRYERMGDSGKPVAFYFCPTCGTTLFWRPAFRPGLVAVAHGCFDDPGSLVPVQSVYQDHRLPWLAMEVGRAAP